MLKPSGPILHFSERISLPLVMGDFMCFKNIIACSEICSDVDFEMIAFEVKGMVAICTWEIIGIYRAPNNDMLAIERSAARKLPT